MVATIQRLVATVQQVVATIQRVVATVQRLVGIVQRLVATIERVVATVQRVVATIQRLVATIQQVVGTIQQLVGIVQQAGAAIPQVGTQDARSQDKDWRIDRFATKGRQLSRPFNLINPIDLYFSPHADVRVFSISQAESTPAHKSTQTDAMLDASGCWVAVVFIQDILFWFV